MSYVRIKRLHDDAIVPTRTNPTDAGLDLYSLDYVDIGPGERVTVGTGIAVEIPESFVGLVCPRSGLAANHGLTVLNAPGIVDSDFRGELCVILHNSRNPIENFGSVKPYRVKAGDRIAQLVLTSHVNFIPREVDELNTTERNEKGFGASGR